METKLSLLNEIVKNTLQNTSREINRVLDEDAYIYRARTSSQDSSQDFEPFTFPPFSPPAGHMTIEKTVRVRG